jgi:hypothetical protein
MSQEKTRMSVRILPLLLQLTATVFVGLVATRGSVAATYQVPGTFASDCSVPVDKDITTWIATVPDESLVKFAAGACYGLDGSFLVPSRNHLTFDGNGATFKAITLNNPTRANWIVTGGTDIVFKRMTILGFNPNPGPNGGGTLINVFTGTGYISGTTLTIVSGSTSGLAMGSEIFIYGQSNCVAPNCVAQNTAILSGSGPYTVNKPQTVGSSGSPVALTGKIDYEWQHGINFQGVANAVVDQVNISSVYGDFVEAQFTGIPKQDGKGGFTGVLPTRNLAVQNSHFDGSGRQGMGLTDIDGFVLKDSYVGNTAQAGIDLELDFNGELGKNISILNNTFGPVWFSVFSNGGAGYSGDVGNVTISGNEQVSPLAVGKESCQPPVYILSPTRVYRSGYTVTNNRFRVFGDVMDFTRVSNVNISDNTLVQYSSECGGAADAAVRLTDAHGVSVTNNNFTGEPQLIVPDSSTGVTTRNNTP